MNFASMLNMAISVLALRDNCVILSSIFSLLFQAKKKIFYADSFAIKINLKW